MLVVLVTVFCRSAPPQSEASQDFLKSCSADGVSCTAASDAATEEEGESVRSGQVRVHRGAWRAWADSTKPKTSDREDGVRTMVNSLCVCGRIKRAV